MDTMRHEIRLTEQTDELVSISFYIDDVLVDWDWLDDAEQTRFTMMLHALVVGLNQQVKRKLDEINYN